MSIKVKFSTGPAEANQLNTLDVGLVSEDTAVTSTTKVVFLENGEPLVVGENVPADSYIKAGDEVMLTYRLEAGYVEGELVDGWVMERANDAYARQLFTLTGDTANTYIQANENFYSVKEVAAHGTGGTQSSIQSVIDNLESTGTTDALSANQGRVLYNMITGKQETLIWVQTGDTPNNIKTINGQSLQGPGNIQIQGGEGTGGTYYYEGSGITINTANTISLSEGTWNLINSKYDKTGGTVSGSVIALEEVSAYGTGGTQSSVQSVIDNLSSTSQTDALSANQGRVLDGKKQDTLVSGVNIKTINNESILGEGNITIQGGGGTGGTSYNAGTGITISSDTISVSQSTWDLIDSKYDKTGGTVSGSVIALEEVSAHGSGGTQSSVQSVIDNLNSNSSTDALSANQGRVLNGLISGKQNTIIFTGSSATLKTINGYSLEGPGDITIQGGGGGTTYSAGTGITISSDTISVSTDVWNTLGNKYDKTGGTVSGSVIALEEVSSYGAGGTQSSVQSVINNLTSNSTTDALSANQGRLLNNLITALGQSKQDVLVSGTNIKTINGSAITGSGNLTIQGGGGGGGNEYYAGANIGITDYVISVTGITDGNLPNLSAGTATYASYLGTSSANYTKATLDTALSGKLGTGDTAADSNKLGGVAASGYAQTSGSYSALTAGTASYAENSGKLNNHTSDYFVDTATTQTISGSKTFNETIVGMKDVCAYGSGSSVATPIVVDNLTTNSSTDALSAKQGKVLNESKQATLVSGTNIKTINGNSILGSGDITIQTGTSLTAGANIQISGNVISVTGITGSSLSSLTAGTATNATKLGGVAASSYAQTNGSYSNMSVGSASYASYLGTSSSNYTKSSLDTALSGKLGTGGTAADSNKLGGTAAAGYAKTGGTYSSMSVGAATSATYTSYLGTSSSNYSKSSLDTALAGKLGTGDTATNSTKWDGYKLAIVSSIPSSPRTDTIYFGT